MFWGLKKKKRVFIDIEYIFEQNECFCLVSSASASVPNFVKVKSRIVTVEAKFQPGGLRRAKKQLTRVETGNYCLRAQN